MRPSASTVLTENVASCSCPNELFLSLPVFRLINTFNFVGKYADRSVGTQGGYQAAGTCVAIAFGLVGGAIVGEQLHLIVYLTINWLNSYLIQEEPNTNTTITLFPAS